jgi:hypothetical protein
LRSSGGRSTRWRGRRRRRRDKIKGKPQGANPNRALGAACEGFCGRGVSPFQPDDSARFCRPHQRRRHQCERALGAACEGFCGRGVSPRQPEILPISAAEEQLQRLLLLARFARAPFSPRFCPFLPQKSSCSAFFFSLASRAPPPARILPASPAGAPLKPFLRPASAVDELLVPSPRARPDPSFARRYWLGDLNYRFDEALATDDVGGRRGGSTRTGTSTHELHDAVNQSRPGSNA